MDGFWRWLLGGMPDRVQTAMATLDSEYQGLCDAWHDAELECLAEGTKPVWSDNVLRELPTETESE